jgi:dihydrofolate reductase
MHDDTNQIEKPVSHRLSIIVAMDKHHLIGNESGLPWHLPADLKRFRKLTTGKPVVMGRKTFEHIGKPLPDRINIVVSRQPDYLVPACIVLHSLDEALLTARTALRQLRTDEIMIIGGSELFQQSLPLVERIYLTIVEGELTGTTYFPESNAFAGEVIHEEAHPADEKNRYPHRFIILERRQGGVSVDSLLNSLAS